MAILVNELSSKEPRKIWQKSLKSSGVVSIWSSVAILLNLLMTKSVALMVELSAVGTSRCFFCCHLYSSVSVKPLEVQCCQIFF
jgi:hypothetical protein